ncbi:MAG TPA: phage tail tube protein [Gryllotalpicola sp.]
MSTQLDCSIGFAKEATYGTYTAPDHYTEFTAEDFDYNPTFVQGAGMRVGTKFDAADRDIVTKIEANGSMTVESLSKGLGALFEAALGTAVSTKIDETDAYQQLITPAANDFLPSYTVQKGIPLLGGGIQAQTFLGAVCSGFDLTVGNAAIPTIKFSFLGREFVTSEAYAAASYPAGIEELTFVGGSIAVGGTVVPPTATALATGGTQVANIREVSATYDNGLDGNGFNLGGQGRRTRKPALGKRTLTGSLTAEYDSNDFRDAYLSQEQMSLLLEFQGITEIDTDIVPTLQLVIPAIKLRGQVPQANAGDVVAQTIPFTTFFNRASSEAVYVAIVTGETAL